MLVSCLQSFLRLSRKRHSEVGGDETQRLGRAYVKRDVLFHQRAAKGIFELLRAPQLGRFTRLFSERGTQMVFHAEGIDQRSVHVESQNGLGLLVGHEASPVSRGAGAKACRNYKVRFCMD